MKKKKKNSLFKLKLKAFLSNALVGVQVDIRLVS